MMINKVHNTQHHRVQTSTTGSLDMWIAPPDKGIIIVQYLPHK